MVIGVDCDGVLRDFTGKLIEVYKREHPKSKCPKDDYDIRKFDLSDYFGIGEDIYDFAFSKHAKEIYCEAPAYPGAAQFINDIKKYGHHVIIVTSQPNELCIKYTDFWLTNNNIKYDELIFEKNKENAPVDILLDDYTKNLKAFSKVGISVCFDRPWNKDWDGLRVINYANFLVGLRK